MKKHFFRQIAKFNFEFMSFNEFFFGLIIHSNFQQLANMASFCQQQQRITAPRLTARQQREGARLLAHYKLDSACQPGNTLLWDLLQVNLFQKLLTSGEHGVYHNCSECQNKTKTTICVHNMFGKYSELTIFMNNEQFVVIL